MRTFLSYPISLAFLASALLMSACQDYSPEVDLQAVESKAFAASGIFDFATSGNVSLNLDFNAPGATNPIWIYTEYPFDEEGELKAGLQSDFACFLVDGKYVGQCDFPTSTKEVFIVTGGMGLPGMLTTEVVEGKIEIYRDYTRTISSNAILEKYGDITVLADFSSSNWSGINDQTTELTTELTQGAITYFGNASSSIKELSAYFEDGRTWQKALQIGGASSTEESNIKRVFKIKINQSGILNIYASTPNNESERIVYLSSTLGTKTDYHLSLQGEIKSGILSANVYKDEIYYLWADNGMRFYAITLLSESSEKTTLNTSDYTMTLAKNTDLITYTNPSNFGNTLDSKMYDNLYLLYPWSLTGKPLVSSSVSSSSLYSGSGYNYFFYYNNEGVAVTNGITTENLTPKQEKEQTGTTDKVYATIEEEDITGYLDFKEKDNDKIEINDLSAGTIKIYLYSTKEKSTQKLTYDNASQREETSCSVLSEAENVYVTEHTFSEITEGKHAITAYDPCQILKIEYTPHGGEKHSFSFNKGNGKTGDNGFFSYTTTSGVVSAELPIYTAKTVTYNNQTYSWGAELSNSLDKNNPQKISFSLPAGTRAKMTIVFKEGQKGSVLVNSTKRESNTNIVTLDLNAPTENTEYVLSRSNSGSRTVYYVAVDYIDKYETITHTQLVKSLENVSNQSLTNIQNRLTNTLWRGSGSKSNAKAQYGDAFNEKYTNADQSKNNITVKEAASLFVTFQAEYNMTSANTFGYYYYDKNNAPTTPYNLKKFVVFPNCTSNVYTTGRKYKFKNGSTYEYQNGSEDYIPLKPGDQVQLMYYDETNKIFTETFPANTVVGWFVIYNGFDAWSLDAANNGSIQSGKVRIGASNNYFDKRVQPETRFYYSDPIFNTDVQARCIQFTDTETKAISLCFEDSYSTADGHSGSQDWTYDDLIVTVSSTPNTAIENNSGNETVTDTETYLSYRQEGVYLFEDIWDGNKTDFDMNDVAVKYSRLYSIGSDNKIASIAEKYTLLNDGATYKDGFAVQLPYNPAAIESVTCSKAGAEAVTLSLTNNQSTVATSDNSARVEYGSSDGKISLVLFDNINTMEMNTTYDFVITFKKESRPSLASSTITNGANGSISDISSFAYGRNSYNPFIIVYEYGLDGNGKRCEIHQPNQAPTQYGIVAGIADQQGNNNRWNVAKTGIAGGYMPFAIDIPLASFVSPHEGTIITEAYSDFGEWAKSLGANKTDWYKRPVSGKTGWDRVR